jgi:hypothetical protein
MLSRRAVVMLGCLPLLVVIGLRLFPETAAHVPVLKSSNLTRVLWFSDVFFLIPVGRALETMTKWPRSMWPLVGACLLCGAVGPRALVAWRQLTAFVTSADETRFQPAAFLDLMQPGSRLAADIDPVPRNFDIKATPFGLLASSGRSILLDGRWRAHLLSQQLIALGWKGMTYYFVPNSPETLARFGIRYFATHDHQEDLRQLGWKPIAATGTLALFESPLPVTPVYIDLAGRQPEFLREVRIAGNEVAVSLPVRHPEGSVVATFLAIPGWKAVVDGARTPIEPREDGMLSVRIRNAHTVSFVYEPYSDAQIVKWLGGSLAITVIVLMMPSSRRWSLPDPFSRSCVRSRFTRSPVHRNNLPRQLP